MGCSEKTLKVLGRDTVDEMDTMAEDDLKKVIVEANAAMKQAKEELEANEEYQKAKATVSLLSSGKREIDKRQKARSNYALDRLNEIGKLTPIERLEWEKARRAAIAKREAEKKAKAEAVDKETYRHEGP